MLPLQKNHPERLATRRDLEKINFSTLQLAGTGNLSPLGRRWLCFLVVLARLGYLGIDAPVWAIVAAQYRAQGQTKSESTFYRAMRHLELSGYIRRQKYRLGPDRFLVKIHFNMDKFAYWLRERTHIQSVTCDYIAAQLSNCEQNEVTNQGSCVNSQNSSLNKDSKPARATLSKGDSRGKTPSGKAGREHPVFYTLRIVTRGMGKTRRRLILARAYLEIFAPKLRASGASWEKWTDRAWLGMSPPEREHVAKTQLVPYLEHMAPVERASDQITRVLRRATRPAPAPRSAPPGAHASPDEVLAMIQAAGLSGALTGEPEKPHDDPVCTLDPDEMEILKRAMARAKGKGADW